MLFVSQYSTRPGEEEEHHAEHQRHDPHHLGLHGVRRSGVQGGLQQRGQSHQQRQDEEGIRHRKVMNPANPGRVANFHAGLQHPVQSHEDRDLNDDGQAAAHGVDLLLAVDAHHLLLHLLGLVLQTLAHFLNAGLMAFILAIEE
jgi:hypothetical protein